MKDEHKLAHKTFQAEIERRAEKTLKQIIKFRKKNPITKQERINYKLLSSSLETSKEESQTWEDILNEVSELDLPNGARGAIWKHELLEVLEKYNPPNLK